MDDSNVGAEGKRCGVRSMTYRVDIGFKEKGRF